MLGVFGELRAQAKYPLHRLGHENRSVGQALGALARDDADCEFGFFLLVAMAFMRLQGARAGKRQDNNKRRHAAPAAQRHG